MRLFTILLLLNAFGVTSVWAGSTSCSEHYVGGASPEITNQRMVPKSRELCFESFGVVHSGITRTALWSAEHLTRSSLMEAKGLKRVDSFHEEAILPYDEKSTLSDFARSGFDKGHLSPNGDMKNTTSQGQSFSLSNIVPQNGPMNRGVWSDIESSVRNYAKKNNELYVITGPLFEGSAIKQLRGNVMIPTHMYKLVYDPKSRQAAAYYIKNEDTSDYQVISVSELESIAGINFLPTMSSQMKTVKLDLPPPSNRHQHGKNDRRSPERTNNTMGDYVNNHTANRVLHSLQYLFK